MELRPRKRVGVVAGSSNSGRNQKRSRRDPPANLIPGSPDRDSQTTFHTAHSHASWNGGSGGLVGNGAVEQRLRTARELAENTPAGRYLRAASGLRRQASVNREVDSRTRALEEAHQKSEEARQKSEEALRATQEVIAAQQRLVGGKQSGGWGGWLTTHGVALGTGYVLGSTRSPPQTLGYTGGPGPNYRSVALDGDLL